MKFGQSIEHDKRNCVVEKSFTKYGGEATSRPFHKKSKLRRSIDQQSEMF